MTAPRWLLALVVATGLLAMHGITTSTASAAAPCGTAVAHEHHSLPASGDLPMAQQATDADPLAGHTGALCLAILVGGLIVGLLLLRGTPRWHARMRGSAAAGVRRTSRPPPHTVLSLLCVSRT